MVFTEKILIHRVLCSRRRLYSLQNNVCLTYLVFENHFLSVFTEELVVAINTFLH